MGSHPAVYFVICYQYDPSDHLRTGQKEIDIFIFPGSGSLSSGSARSVHRSESRLDSSVGSSATPTSPVHVNGTHLPWSKAKPANFSSSSRSSGSRRSRSEENVPGTERSGKSPRDKSYDWRSTGNRSNTETDFKNKGFQILPSKLPPGNIQNGANAWSAKFRSNEVLPNLEGNSIPTSKHTKKEAGSGKSKARWDQNGRKTSPESELPRLIGTKSQASTASSSATRDSGISVTERQSDMETVTDRLRARAGSVRRGGAGQISVDTLPVNGQAVSLARRGSGDSQEGDREARSLTSLSRQERGKSNLYRRSPITKSSSKELASPEELVITPVNDPKDGGTPRSPKFFPDEIPIQPSASLLLRPVDNSPFSSRSKRGKSASSDNLSTPYSQISGISTYDYEDDFTSDESEFSTLTNKSKARSSSKIPIKRSSSLHRRSGIIKNGSQGDLNKNSLAQPPSYVPEKDITRDKEESREEVFSSAEINSAPSLTPKAPMTTGRLNRSKLSPRKINPRTKSVSPHVQSRQRADSEASRLITAKSTSDIARSAVAEKAEEVSHPVNEKRERSLPATEPPKRRTYSHSVSVPGRSFSSISGPRRSTASSVSSTTSLQTLPLVTVPTLKSPYDGVKIVAWDRPEEALEKMLVNLENHEEWEKNMTGLSGVLRLVHHHPETVLVEYKQVTQLVLKQVKNLRSQVARAAVHLVGDMFDILKRSMESDLEKIALPLIMKTGETNRFLREDCNQALDKMVDNVSPSKSILVITAEPLNSKNAVIRTTVSRLLANITNKIGPSKALTGSRDITERLLPAVAKLAQDGSLEARIYAKMTLKTLMDHEDFERILKKNLTTNTLRNLEKVLDSVRSNGLSSASSSSRPYQISKRRANNGKTL